MMWLYLLLARLAVWLAWRQCHWETKAGCTWRVHLSPESEGMMLLDVLCGNAVGRLVVTDPVSAFTVTTLESLCEDAKWGRGLEVKRGR